MSDESSPPAPEISAVCGGNESRGIFIMCARSLPLASEIVAVWGGNIGSPAIDSNDG
jgi:hypothetical protein